MGWFSKKEDDEKVPELPKAPELRNVPQITQQNAQNKSDDVIPELPSFPNNSKNETFNQNIVKHAVDDDDESYEGNTDDNYEYSSNEEEVTEELPSFSGSSSNLNNPNPNSRATIPEPPTKNNKKSEGMIPSINQINKKDISDSQTPRTVELSRTSFDKTKLQEKMSKQDEPIFVRIDKFQAAQKNFDKIKAKSKEIETILRKVKDVKEKEDKEIQSWTEDLEMIKSRLTEIESDIFDKI